MLKRIIKKFLRQFGYEIRRIPPAVKEDKRFYTLYRYLKDDGSFDYEKYRQTQEQGNICKIEKAWVLEENVAFLSNYIKNIMGTPKFGICHGTRKGKEQGWFKKYLGCKIIGTEISGTAEQFPYTIQWDFHKAKPEWINAADFIYSNSFDHSYNPEQCLDAWMSCIKTGGLCILEHSYFHGEGEASELDPFGADITLMPYLITTWGKGKYGVRELIKAPKKSEYVKYLYFIVIQKF